MNGLNKEEMDAMAKKVKHTRDVDEMEKFNQYSDRITFSNSISNPNDNPKGKGNGKGKGSGNQNQNQKDKDEKRLPVYPTYKYSRPFLHEAVIIGGFPYFISYDSKFDKIIKLESIHEAPSRILRPPDRERYPYTPYEFENAEQLQRYLEIAKHESIDTLFRRAKYIVEKYNDQDEHIQTLLAIDIVWSYFQDKFAITHYLGITGENEGGKSTMGDTFEAVAYRVLNMTNPSAANIFRVLGMIEPGQCTIILDESDMIYEDEFILAILKSGYSKLKRTPKTNTNTWTPEWFYCYGLKIIIGERSPNRLKSKGLIDRAFLISTFPRDTEYNIKEVVNPEETSPTLKAALDELLEFRKIMLIHRLYHFEDHIPNLDVGVKRRNEELCKSALRLFYGSKSQDEVVRTFQKFVDARSTRKSTSLEAMLVPVMIELINEKGSEVPSKDVWEYVKGHLDGEPSMSNADVYIAGDFTLYSNTITKILESKFGVVVKHTNKGNRLIFNIEKLVKLDKTYNASTKIQLKLKDEGQEKSEGSVSSEGSSEYAPPDNEKEEYENTRENPTNSQSQAQDKPLAYSQMPSQPSQPSPFDMSEEAKAARLKEYERLSALARKKLAKDQLPQPSKVSTNLNDMDSITKPS